MDSDPIEALSNRVGNLELTNSYNGSVSSLSAMFPNTTLSKIRQVLSENDDDFDRACDVLLNEGALDTAEPATTITDGHSNEKFLSEVFPHIPLSQIRAELSKENNEVDKVYDILMNHDVVRSLSDKGVAQKHRKVKIDLSRVDIKSSKTWDTLNEEVSAVVALTGAPDRQIRPYYHRSHSIAETIILLIENEAGPDTATEAENNVSENTEPTRRVQSNRAVHVSHPSDGTNSTVRHAQKVQNYTPSANDYDQLEIEKLKKPELFEINDAFYAKALAFFSGDVAKVVEVCTRIAELHAMALTFPAIRASKQRTVAKASDATTPTDPHTAAMVPTSSQTAIRSTVPSHELIKSSDEYRVQASQTSDHRLKQHFAMMAGETRKAARAQQDREIGDIAEKRLLEAARSYVLDLHGITVQIGLNVTKRALSQWWEDQLKAREQSTGSHTVEDFTVITGRGIHSTGGVSRMKLSIKNYLKSSPFDFEEDSSKFIVKGKKRSR